MKHAEILWVQAEWKEDEMVLIVLKQVMEYMQWTHVREGTWPCSVHGNMLSTGNGFLHVHGIIKAK